MTYPPAAISEFHGLIAVITGGGTGMGRELTRQLAATGCSVAICDVSEEAMAETIAVAVEESTAGGFIGSRFTSFVADVSDAAAMDSFAAHIGQEFRTEHINLLFNNAGIGGGGSVVESTHAAWDRVFGVCWGGVLNGTRSFMPMLQASDRGQVVNTSSINGMWACLGSNTPHTAYSTAKFAVKGFTESLMVDFKINAPYLTAAVVMPGHIGTSIMRNSYQEFGRDPSNLADSHVAEIRADLAKRGLDLSEASDADIRALVAQHVDGFEQSAPTSADEAATIILDGVRNGTWRILIGEDAAVLDEALRADPTGAYSEAFTESVTANGHLSGLIVG